jgi:hypothetical protein
MIVILSERRFAERIRQLEGIEDTSEEIFVRWTHYGTRLLKHLEQFGILKTATLESNGNIASFQFDISRVGRNWQSGDFDFAKLNEGLNLLDPVAVSLEEQDLAAICTGPIQTAMVDRWDEYAHTLQRILPGQIESAVEAACLKYAWGDRMEVSYTGNPSQDAQLQYELDTAQLQRAGLRNPLERFEAQEAQRQADEERETQRKNAQAQWWENHENENARF